MGSRCSSGFSSVKAVSGLALVFLCSSASSRWGGHAHSIRPCGRRSPMAAAMSDSSRPNQSRDLGDGRSPRGRAWRGRTAGRHLPASTFHRAKSRRQRPLEARRRQGHRSGQPQSAALTSIRSNARPGDATAPAAVAFAEHEAFGCRGKRAVERPLVRVAMTDENGVDGRKPDLVDAIAAAEIDGFQLGLTASFIRTRKRLRERWSSPRPSMRRPSPAAGLARYPRRERNCPSARG
jgi:hypothetical protein